MSLDPKLVSTVDTSGDTRNALLALANRSNLFGQFLTGTGSTLKDINETLTNYNTTNLTNNLSNMNSNQLREVFNEEDPFNSYVSSLGLGVPVDRSNENFLKAFESARIKEGLNNEDSAKALDVMSSPDGKTMIGNMSNEEFANYLGLKNRDDNTLNTLGNIRDKAVAGEISKDLPSLIQEYADENQKPVQEVYQNKAFLEQLANEVAANIGYTGKPIKYENLKLPNLASGDDRVLQQDKVAYDMTRDLNDFTYRLNNNEFNSVSEAQEAMSSYGSNLVVPMDQIEAPFITRAIEESLTGFNREIDNLDKSDLSPQAISTILAEAQTLASAKASRYGVKNLKKIEEETQTAIANRLANVKAFQDQKDNLKQAVFTDVLGKVYKDVGGNDFGIYDAYKGKETPNSKYTELNTEAYKLLMDYVHNNAPSMSNSLNASSELKMQMLGPMVKAIVGKAVSENPNDTKEQMKYVKNILKNNTQMQQVITTYLHEFNNSGSIIFEALRKSAGDSLQNKR